MNLVESEGKATNNGRTYEVCSHCGWVVGGHPEPKAPEIGVGKAKYRIVM